MSAAIELYCKAGESEVESLVEFVLNRGGSLDFREMNGTSCAAPILTFCFDYWSDAAQVTEELRGRGEHVEGPMDY